MATTAAPDPSASRRATTDAALAARIPLVDGFEVRELPADDVLWRFVDVPSTFTVHHGVVHGPDGERVARIVVAKGPSSDPPIEEYVRSSFDPLWQFPAGTPATADDGNLIVVSNSVMPRWTDVEGGAVLSGTWPPTGVTQWAWGADDLVWIVRGEPTAEPFVRGLVARHVAVLDPYDVQGMTGNLWDHTPALDGFGYRDLPRDATLAAVPTLVVPDCLERVYVGYLKADGATDVNLVPGDLRLVLMKIGGECARNGYAEEVTSALAAGPGWTTTAIAGADAITDPYNMVLAVGDVVIHLFSDRAETMTDLAGTIEQFVARQPS